MTLDRRRSKLVFVLASVSWVIGALVWPAQSIAHGTTTDTTPPKKVNFSRDILPVLSDKCFKCHGPDSESRMAGMRLDRADGAFANRSGKFPIVPGKPEHSMVVQRITSKDAPMPPPDSGKTLSQAQIKLLIEWIREGAEYDKLWSFEPLPKTIPIPQVKGAWPRNDIDRFVLARLQKEKLSPSPAASKPRWLRRVTLDLTGLPPTEKEISDFQKDDSPAAYETVVDRLLASPHFGERAAVDWLDAARYSDSYGYQSDLIMPVWPYRDWVIKAFNQNLPYDRFLTDQLAGDLLPNPTRDERIATAFNRLHRQSNEGGSIALEFKTAYAADRVDTFGTAVLGLTVGCARCHDHKFDPITQREYYQLFGYFNSIDEYGLLLSTEIVPSPSMLLPTPDQEAKLRDLHSACGAADDKLTQDRAAAEPAFESWLKSRPLTSTIPDVVAHFGFDKLDKDHFQNDLPGPAFGEKLGSVDTVTHKSRKAVSLDGDNGLAIRGLPAKERSDSFTWSFLVDDTRRDPTAEVLLHRTGGTDVGFCGFDLLLEDGHLTARVMRAWPGNAVAIRTNGQIPKGAWSHIAWSWDGSGRAKGLKLYIDGHLAESTVLEDSLWKKINAYGDLGDSRGDWTFSQRFRDKGFKGGEIADVAFATRALSPIEVAQLADGHSLTDALASHTPIQPLKEYFESAIDPKIRADRALVKSAQLALADGEEPVYEMPIMQETKKPVPAYLLARGNYDSPRNAQTLVRRDVPKALPPLECVGPNNRLALAKWVTRPDNPLTARVAVNRFWQMMFGTGLVETTENFGIQGSRPSHKELLDYLALRFIKSGWNVKALVKTIALSATYRQDSGRNPKLKDADPSNRLLARGPSFRLSAEMIRDTALSAAGLLYDKLGGAPVNPYQPAGIWQENNTMSPPFVQSKGPDLFRRSIYSTWKRTTPVPTMLLFDATSREACVVRRPMTNTPLQALALLNDVQYVEAARVLAELVLKREHSDQARIDLAFERLAGRKADPAEMAILMQTLKEQREIYAKTPDDAARLLKSGSTPPDASLSPVEIAAMTVTVQTILNSDAVIWRR